MDEDRRLTRRSGMERQGNNREDTMSLKRRDFIIGVASIAGFISIRVGPAQAQTQYRIALSNGWVGSEWRTQMIEEAQAAAAAWADAGVNIEVLVQSKNVDVQGQIADVTNFINDGVNAIIINPNSPTAFSPAFAQAKAAGITVLSTDGEIASADAVFVGIDQKEWAMLSSKWLAEKIGGKGTIVCMNGIAGHPANQARVEGYTEVFAGYPDIKIENEANGDWDPAKAQQLAQTLLATYPDLTAIWTQDGMAEGVWRAIEEAGKSATMVATGELRHSFVKQWAEKGWQSAASINPPGCMANAVHVAVHMLQGGALKDGVLAGPNANALYVPTKLITSDEIADVAASMADKPDFHFVSLVLSPDEIKSAFFA
jgi:ribose transport system substrate-binding protein